MISTTLETDVFVVSVNFFKNQFRIGLARMERTVRERMSTQELEIITPTSLINIRPIIATINEIFRFITVVTVYGPEQPSCRTSS